MWWGDVCVAVPLRQIANQCPRGPKEVQGANEEATLQRQKKKWQRRTETRLRCPSAEEKGGEGVGGSRDILRVQNQTGETGAAGACGQQGTALYYKIPRWEWVVGGGRGLKEGLPGGGREEDVCVRQARASLRLTRVRRCSRDGTELNCKKGNGVGWGGEREGGREGRVRTQSHLDFFKPPPLFQHV